MDFAFLAIAAADTSIQLSIMEFLELIGAALLVGGAAVSIRNNTKDIEKLDNKMERSNKEIIDKISEIQGAQEKRFEAMEQYFGQALDRLSDKLGELVDGIRTQLSRVDITLETHGKDIEFLKDKNHGRKQT